MGRKKTVETEWKGRTLGALPVSPSDALTRYAQGLKAIMPPMIIYGRESVPTSDDYYDTCLGRIGKVKYRWGARCRCTECGEDFTAGWREGKIAILQMEDGEFLDGWTDGSQYETVLIGENEEMYCPLCGERATAVKRSGIRGRTYRTRIAELTNLGSTTVILYWMAERWLDKTGYSKVNIYPSRAVALSPCGKLHSYGRETEYNRTYKTVWKEYQKFRDPEEVPFCPGGDFFCQEYGAEYFNNAGDMTGTTGEKTGIDSFFDDENAYYAATYWKVWKETPTIEALVKTGGAAIASDYVSLRRNWCTCTEMEALDLRERKPHRIAGVEKQEYRYIVKEAWKLSLLSQFRAYRKIWPKTSVEEFTKWARYLNDHKMESFRAYYGDGLGRICRYIEKHGDRINTGYYLDYRKMLGSLSALTGRTEPLSEEEKFPRDLIAAHNRVMEAERAIRDENRRKGTKEQIETFASLKKKHAALEWKQGEFCIVIPACPEDLVREGDVLHHCVGGYASQHCNGKMIFFVRHARRPERSWYTLNEDVKGTAVRRIQLHGYRNEMVKGKTLTIPKEVTDFVQRWEKEILAPYLKNKGRKSA